MQFLTISALLAVLSAQTESQGILGKITNPFGILDNNAKKPCERDPLPMFQEALNDFSIRLTKRVATTSNGAYAISPFTIWLSLASLAEFSDESVQKELFAALKLPEEKCIREKFYQLALHIETPGQDVRFERTRALAIDERAVLNQNWVSFSQSTNILNYLQVPFDSATIQHVYESMAIPSKAYLDGHSIMLDRLEYEGLWTSAFSEGRIENGPFYDDLGQEMTTQPYMKMKSRVRLGHIPIINAKVLALPVGNDGRYTMLLTMGIKNNTIKRIMSLLMSSIIIDMISSLTLSLIPIEVAVPVFTMNASFNTRPMLEDLGFGRFFSDPAATRLVSDPPALPCDYLQSIIVNMTTASLDTEKGSSGSMGSSSGISGGSSNIMSGFFGMASETATGLASAVGRDFIANKPFIFTLVETKTKVPVFTGIFTGQ